MVNCRQPSFCCNGAYLPTKNEQIANIVTHGVRFTQISLYYGIVTVIQIWILPNAISVWRLVNSASEKEVFPVAIYGLALEMLFIISTIFHTVSLLVRYERLFINLLFNWFSYIIFLLQ